MSSNDYFLSTFLPYPAVRWQLTKVIQVESNLIKTMTAPLLPPSPLANPVFTRVVYLA